jgi:hypothetical protein
MSRPYNHLNFKPDYELEASKIENFLKTFVDSHLQKDDIHDQRKYMIQMVIYK